MTDNQHRFEAVVNLTRPSTGDPVWVKHREDSLRLHGCHETFSVSHVFESAASEEIYKTSINRLVSQGPNGVNVTVLCFGYTDFVALAQRAFETILRSPDEEARFVSATAVHIGASGEVKGVFNRNTTPTVKLWDNKWLCVRNTTTRVIKSFQDIDDFFNVPMVSHEATLVVADVFQAVEAPKQNRATVLFFYVPEKNETLMQNFWSLLESEIDKPSAIVSSPSPLSAVARHTACGSGFATAIAPLKTDHESCAATMSIIRKLISLQQVRIFPNVQVYSPPPMAAGIPAMFKEKLQEAAKYVKDRIIFGRQTGQEAAQRAVLRYWGEQQYYMQKALVPALEDMCAKGQSRVNVVRNQNKQAQQDIAVVQEDVKHCQGLLQSGWKAKADGETHVESSISRKEAHRKELAEFKAILAAKQQAQAELDEKLRTARAATAIKANLPEKQLQDLDSKQCDIEKQKAALVELEARKEKEKQMALRETNFVDEHHKKLEALSSAKTELEEKKQEQIQQEKSEETTRQSLDDRKLVELLDRKSTLTTYLNDLREQIRSGSVRGAEPQGLDTATGILPGDDDDLVMKDISILIQQPPTSRAAKSKSPRPKTSAPKRGRTASTSSVSRNSTPKKKESPLKMTSPALVRVNTKRCAVEQLPKEAKGTPVKGKTPRKGSKTTTPIRHKGEATTSDVAPADDNFMQTPARSVTGNKKAKSTASAKKTNKVVTPCKHPSPVDESPVGVWARRVRDAERERRSGVRTLFPEKGTVSDHVRALFEEKADKKPAKRVKKIN